MSNNLHSNYIDSIDATYTIRRAGAHDDLTVARLAELDTAPSLRGICLIAERDGMPVAACEIASGRVIADPFKPTADVVDLLETRARALRHEDDGRGHRFSLRRLGRLMSSPAPSSAMRRGTGAV